jgi:hypothetical protein
LSQRCAGEHSWSLHLAIHALTTLSERFTAQFDDRRAECTGV